MIISEYEAGALHRSFGMDMSSIGLLGPIDEMGVGASWGRVGPGVTSQAHQHDEIETFVIVSGSADLVVDSGRHKIEAGMVIQFEPFETHHLENTGDEDLLFATFYWRNPDQAARSGLKTGRRRFDERPVFVFSSPTTPNGGLHLGHLSGPYLGADVFTRFQRMNGVRAWHIAGSDDFQSYVEGRARKEGRPPAEVAAHYSKEILATHHLMDIQVDQYTVSNQDPGYVDGVRAFFGKVAASDLVSVRTAPALFDGESGRYLYEVDVSGTCPTCGGGTGGNMCEECGEPNFCADLGDPRSHTSEAPPRIGELERYSLALHKLMPDVEAHHRLGRVPARVRELAARLAGRERLDLAISHPASWGVAPADSAVADDQVIWVWIDMAYRFLHGIEALGRAHGEDWRADRPDPDWKIVHFLGYDNTFYHAVFCPALYKLAHPEWTPDIDYHLNEFYELDFDKFSTSRRHAVWGKDVLDPETVDAVRFHLSRTRPEGRRTNFTAQEFEKTFDDVLIGTWQAWLNDLGARLDAGYGGIVPDAGIWTPEHTAFHARLGRRLEELTNALGQDGFSLNRAAEALAGIVEDTLVFSRAERATTGLPGWKDETRTAIALELAAARLLAFGAAPVMPRFAAKLALALGQGEPDEWPELVRLVAPGTRVDLTHRVFFGAAPESSPEPSPDSAELPWLSALIRESLQLDAALPVADRTMVELGMTSMQCIALQYQILEKLDVDVSVETLLGARTVGALAVYLEAGADGAAAETETAEAAEVAEAVAAPATRDGGPRP